MCVLPFFLHTPVVCAHRCGLAQFLYIELIVPTARRVRFARIGLASIGTDIRTREKGKFSVCAGWLEEVMSGRRGKIVREVIRDDSRPYYTCTGGKFNNFSPVELREIGRLENAW